MEKPSEPTTKGQMHLLQLLVFGAQEGQEVPCESLLFIFTPELTIAFDMLQQELIKAIQGLFLDRTFSVHHNRHHSV